MNIICLVYLLKTSDSLPQYNGRENDRIGQYINEVLKKKSNVEEKRHIINGISDAGDSGKRVQKLDSTEKRDMNSIYDRSELSTKRTPIFYPIALSNTTTSENAQINEKNKNINTFTSVNSTGSKGHSLEEQEKLLNDDDDDDDEIPTQLFNKNIKAKQQNNVDGGDKEYISEEAKSRKPRFIGDLPSSNDTAKNDINKKEEIDKESETTEEEKTEEMSDEAEITTTIEKEEEPSMKDSMSNETEIFETELTGAMDLNGESDGDEGKKDPKKDEDDDESKKDSKKDEDDDESKKDSKKDEDDDESKKDPKKDEDDDESKKDPKKDEDDDESKKDPKKDEDDDESKKDSKKDEDDDESKKDPKKDDDDDDDDDEKTKRLSKKLEEKSRREKELEKKLKEQEKTIRKRTFTSLLFALLLVGLFLFMAYDRLGKKSRGDSLRAQQEEPLLVTEEFY